MRWALCALVIDHQSVSCVDAGLGVAWHTANSAILAEGHALLLQHPSRFKEVQVLGADEHVWRHTRTGPRYVTVVIDLTPVRDKSGPARLLAMIEVRSKAVFKSWLNSQSAGLRDGIEVVAMDGFTGYKTAAAEELPAAVAVMDPFHVIRLAGEGLDECRRRVQQELHGHRGRGNEPLFKARRVLHTGAGLLTDRQYERVQALFANPNHLEVEAAWSVYQRMVTAYREPDRKLGKFIMAAVISSLAEDVPEQFFELRRLGRTLRRRAADILAFFDRPGTSNGPTEAINGRLEHLRGSALGLRNLTHYIARSLLETGGFRPQLHAQMR